jgi:hypothetical protein
MLNAREARAHLTIIDAADRAHMCEINDRTALLIMNLPLQEFRARCNCGRVLNISPWVNGMRLLRCNWCGFTAKELPL